MPTRVAIIGNSGAGKSTLASLIAAWAGVPCLDLDTVAWEPDQPAVPRDEFESRAAVAAFCRHQAGWVLEGCYANLIEEALTYGPHLIFVNPGREACMSHCKNRPWESHKYPSKAAQDKNLTSLLKWVADYDQRTGPMSLPGHAACFASYQGPKRELLVPTSAHVLAPDLAAWLSCENDR